MQDNNTAATPPSLGAPQHLLDGWYLWLSLRLIQYGCWLSLQLPIALLIRNYRSSLTSDDLGGSAYMIAANHQSALDPFIILACLPWNIFTHMLPYRFFLHNAFLRFFPLRWFLLGGGCFPARPGTRYTFGLGAAEHFLKAGQTIFIFPEGMRSAYATVKPKRGVAELAALPNVEIIPVKILWQRRGYWRRSFTINIGKPFAAQESSAEEIMACVHSL